MKPFHKSSAPQLDFEAANRILEQAFEANQMDANSIPLEVFASYSSYRRDHFILQRSILVFLVILFLLLPLLFVPSTFTIREDGTTGRTYNPVYELTVDSFLPVARINASIDKHNIPVYEVDSHIYSIAPDQNGRMAVTVTLVNRQTMTQYIDVASVDHTLPAVTSCGKKDDLIYLYLSDEESGVDFESITALDTNGQAVTPVSVDEPAGCVTFPVVSDILNVYVADFAGNKLQLILSIK